MEAEEEEVSFVSVGDQELVQDNEEEEHLQEEEEQRQRAGWKEIFLFFLCGIGCNLGWTAVLSNLVFYNETLGMDSYLLLNLVVFGPIFPVTLAQVRWDAAFDKRYQNTNSFLFRGCLCFAVTLLATLGLPWASVSLTWLGLTSLLLGLASSALQGTLKQLGAFVYPECGYLAASVTSGMQASALCVLAVTLATGFGSSGSHHDGLVGFYWIVATQVGLSWIAFLLLMSYSNDVRSRLRQRDSSMRPPWIDNEPLLSSSSSSSEYQEFNSDDNQEETELSFASLWKITAPCCVSVTLTVGSSMLVSSWFNRVPSRSLPNLPQVLFYTRLIADLVGRLVTFYGPLRSSRVLVALSTLRLLFVPVFFVYISSNTDRIIPRNDGAAILAVLVNAFASGYLSTTCYQQAPFLLNDNQRNNHVILQASILNVCFAAAIFLGITASLALRQTGFH